MDLNRSKTFYTACQKISIQTSFLFKIDLDSSAS